MKKKAGCFFCEIWDRVLCLSGGGWWVFIFQSSLLVLQGTFEAFLELNFCLKIFKKQPFDFQRRKSCAWSTGKILKQHELWSWVALGRSIRENPLQTQDGYGVLVGSPTNRALTLRYATKDITEEKLVAKNPKGLGDLGICWRKFFLRRGKINGELVETCSSFTEKPHNGWCDRVLEKDKIGHFF